MPIVRPIRPPIRSPIGSPLRSGLPWDEAGGGSAPWTPADLSTLAHWYRGTDVILASTKITTFTDLEGSDSLVQATDASRPVYSASIATLGGKPGGVFTAASTHFIRDGFTAIPQPFTIVVAWSQSVIGATKNILGGTLGARIFIRSTAANAVEFFAGGTLATTQTVAADTSYRGVFVFNGTSSKVRVNGVSRYSGAGNVGANSISDLTLGLEASGTDYLDGSIAEAMVLSGDLIADAASLAALETYLTARYA
jgi:hypothetical protein